MSESGNGGNAGACFACAGGLPHEPWTDEDAALVETALKAADADRAGHWPTVAGWLACEVRRLRARVAELEAAGSVSPDDAHTTTETTTQYVVMATRPDGKAQKVAHEGRERAVEIAQSWRAPGGWGRRGSSASARCRRLPAPPNGRQSSDRAHRDRRLGAVPAGLLRVAGHSTDGQAMSAADDQRDDGPECDHPPRTGGACLPCSVDYYRAENDRLHAELAKARAVSGYQLDEIRRLQRHGDAVAGAAEDMAHVSSLVGEPWRALRLAAEGWRSARGDAPTESGAASSGAACSNLEQRAEDVARTDGQPPADERALLADVVQRLRQLSTICGDDEDVTALADRVVAHRDRSAAPAGDTTAEQSGFLTLWWRSAPPYLRNAVQDASPGLVALLDSHAAAPADDTAGQDARHRIDQLIGLAAAWDARADRKAGSGGRTGWLQAQEIRACATGLRDWVAVERERDAERALRGEELDGDAPDLPDHEAIGKVRREVARSAERNEFGAYIKTPVLTHVADLAERAVRAGDGHTAAPADSDGQGRALADITAAPDHFIPAEGRDGADALVPVWEFDSGVQLDHANSVSAWIEGVAGDGDLSEGPAVDAVESDARKLLAAIAWHRRLAAGGSSSASTDGDSR